MSSQFYANIMQQKLSFHRL